MQQRAGTHRPEAELSPWGTGLLNAAQIGETKAEGVSEPTDTDPQVGNEPDEMLAVLPVQRSRQR